MDETGRLPWIDEDAIAASHPVLFHYTKASTLELILDSGGMQATHFAHTNDAEEFHGLRSVFPELMGEAALKLAKRLRAQGAFRRAPSNDELGRIIPADAQAFHDSMVRSLPRPFHLTCFSKHTLPQHNLNGLLTLWRFYGGEGEGIALGFNTKKLIDCSYAIMKSHALAALYLDEVRYGPDDPMLRSRLGDASGLTEMFLEFIESVVTERELEFGNRETELFQFTVLAACAKHADFADEREVRLVATPAFPGHEGGREICVRDDDRYLLLPCLPALEEIIVGPSERQAEMLSGVVELLRLAGLNSIRVRLSQTPFRFIKR